MMKIKWVLMPLLVIIVIIFAWPKPEIILQQVEFADHIAPKERSKIILVYNAKSGKLNVVKDFFIKEFLPSKYPCNLCSITFGTFTMKKQWKAFLDSLPLEKEFLHKDEFASKYALSFNQFPAIFVADTNRLSLVITQQQLNSIHTLPALQQMLLQKLKP